MHHGMHSTGSGESNVKFGNYSPIVHYKSFQICMVETYSEKNDMIAIGDHYDYKYVPSFNFIGSSQNLLEFFKICLSRCKRIGKVNRFLATQFDNSRLAGCGMTPSGIVLQTYN